MSCTKECLFGNECDHRHMPEHCSLLQENESDNASSVIRNFIGSGLDTSGVNEIVTEKVKQDKLQSFFGVVL